MLKSLCIISFYLIFCASLFAQNQLSVVSPNGKLKTEISIGEQLEYRILHETDLMLINSPISLTLTDGRSLGKNPKILKAIKKSVNTEIDAVIYKKRKVKDQYNELIINFKDDFSVVFRAYDEAIAYRFVTNMKAPFEVQKEQADFNFADNFKVYVAYVNDSNGSKNTFEKQFANSHENTYKYFALADWTKQRLAMSPLLVEGPNKKKICILEADLLNYPGMYLNNADGSNSLKGVFAPYPKEFKQGGHNLLQTLVQSSEKYIAKCKGETSFPWRAIIVSEKDEELLNSDMVYKLASASKISDISWIKPGKVAWDWWNDWNLRNVDFETGVNTATYKYYIDFAAKNGIEYVILDEGWAVNKKADLFQIVPEIDLKEIIAYAKSKNVNIILWAGFAAIEKDIEGVCKHYSEMGIKGFKVDFMDRDDQILVEFLTKLAQTAAKYKLLIDYHGVYKPTGLQRTYPNVINFEGVFGMEQMKWEPASTDQVTYDVTMPFIRMVAGPVDYTQGAMRNSSKNNYRPVNSEPMSQGTRCRQLSQYVVFESPLNMLCDSPSNYMANQECTDFIATVPSVWDETIAMNGEITKYITVARRKNNVWYVGGMTNWDSRSLELDLSFLGEGKFSALLYRDGVNADRTARDYKKEIVEVPTDRKMIIKLAKGGGFAMKITVVK